MGKGEGRPAAPGGANVSADAFNRAGDEGERPGRRGVQDVEDSGNASSTLAIASRPGRPGPRRAVDLTLNVIFARFNALNRPPREGFNALQTGSFCTLIGPGKRSRVRLILHGG